MPISVRESKAMRRFAACSRARDAATAMAPWVARKAQDLGFLVEGSELTGVHVQPHKQVGVLFEEQPDGEHAEYAGGFERAGAELGPAVVGTQIIGAKHSEFQDRVHARAADQVVLDLVRLQSDLTRGGDGFEFRPGAATRDTGVLRAGNDLDRESTQRGQRVLGCLGRDELAGDVGVDGGKRLGFGEAHSHDDAQTVMTTPSLCRAKLTRRRQPSQGRRCLPVPNTTEASTVPGVGSRSAPRAMRATRRERFPLGQGPS